MILIAHAGYNAIMKFISSNPGRVLTISVVVLLAGYVLFEQFFTYTSNAYIAADVIVVAPRVNGYVRDIDVDRNQAVNKADVLLTLDPTPYELALRQQESQLSQSKAARQSAKAQTQLSMSKRDEVQASLNDAEGHWRRTQDLLKKGVASQQTEDDAYRTYLLDKAALAAAVNKISVDQRLETQQEAAIEGAQAAVDYAQYQLEQTKLTSPIDGIVATYTLRPGDYVETGTPVLAVVSRSNWRIVANVTERHAARLKPGMTVWFQVSTDPLSIKRGTVHSITPGISREASDAGVLPYIALSTDWIRLPRRFPVEVNIGDADTSHFLHGGDARIFMFH